MVEVLALCRVRCLTTDRAVVISVEVRQAGVSLFSKDPALHSLLGTRNHLQVAPRQQPTSRQRASSASLCTRVECEPSAITTTIPCLLPTGETARACRWKPARVKYVRGWCGKAGAASYLHGADLTSYHVINKRNKQQAMYLTSTWPEAKMSVAWKGDISSTRCTSRVPQRHPTRACMHSHAP